MSNDQRLVAQNCRNIRQGDVVDLPKLYFPEVTIGDFKKLPTPSGVAIVSQTCDVVVKSDGVVFLPFVETSSVMASGTSTCLVL